MKQVLLVVCLFGLCAAWVENLGTLAVAGSSSLDLNTYYSTCEGIANTNTSASKFGRIGSAVLVNATALNTSLEIRMYAVKTADVWHTHVPNELLCVANGNGVFSSSSGESWVMGPGDCTFMSGATYHYFRSYGTNTTGDFAVLVNTFLPAPFTRTDNFTIVQNDTSVQTVRNVWAEGNFGISGATSQNLSAIATSSILLNNTVATFSKLVGVNGQTLNGSFANSDLQIIVLKGGLNVTVGNNTYSFKARDVFVLPAKTYMYSTVVGSTSLLTINSPPIGGLPFASAAASSAAATSAAATSAAATSAAATSAAANSTSAATPSGTSAVNSATSAAASSVVNTSAGGTNNAAGSFVHPSVVVLVMAFAAYFF